MEVRRSSRSSARGSRISVSKVNRLSTGSSGGRRVSFCIDDVILERYENMLAFKRELVRRGILTEGSDQEPLDLTDHVTVKQLVDLARDQDRGFGQRTSVLSGVDEARRTRRASSMLRASGYELEAVAMETSARSTGSSEALSLLHNQDPEKGALHMQPCLLGRESSAQKQRRNGRGSLAAGTESGCSSVASTAITGSADLSETEVVLYNGFTEHVRRLVFRYGDFSGGQGKGGPWTLTTLLANGDVAETEDLSATNGIVVALPFAQSLPPDRARPFSSTPFVRRRDDGTYALVQAWSETALSLEGGESVRHNPDPGWYEPQAVNEFHTAMAGLFGDAAVAELGVQFSHMRKEHPVTVYVGLAEALMRFLEQNSVVATEFGVKELRTDGASPKPLAFTFWTTPGQHSSAVSSFAFVRDRAYVIYKDQANTPLVVKKLLEFEQTAKFHKMGRRRPVCCDNAV